MLSYSVLSRSKFKLKPIDADALIREIIDQYPGFQKPQVDIRIEGALPVVWANEATLTQCISNLLGNAIKFVPKGTQPRIVLRSDVGDKEKRRFGSRDNGIGIAPNDLERIFGIFVKVHAADSYARHRHRPEHRAARGGKDGRPSRRRVDAWTKAAASGLS